ncbi:MAG: ATP-binding protein [Bacteroidetes bacterium]|nr:ATP-binding protein [Bacteroidota bacterium]
MKSQQGGIFFWGIPWFLVALLLFLSIFGIRQILDHRNSPQSLFREFKKANAESETQLAGIVNLLTRTFDTIPGSKHNSGFDGTREKDVDSEFFLFVYKGDSLVYWNNNTVVFPAAFSIEHKKTNFACLLKNGWYEFHTMKKGSFRFLGCYCIKSDFPFQNDFIKNQFSSGYGIPASVKVVKKIGTYPVYSSDKTYLFSLDFDNYHPNPGGFTGGVFMLFIAGSLFLFFALFHFLSSLTWFHSRVKLLVVTYCFTIVFLRIVQSYFGFPAEIYKSDLFSPAWYSSSAFLPSLGDYTMNVTILLLISLVFYTRISVKSILGITRRNQQFVWTVFAIFLLLVFFQAVGYFLTDLVINSALPVNLQNISGLTYESGFGLFIITSLLFSLWLVSSRILDLLFFTVNDRKQLVLSLTIVVTAYFLVSYISGWSINYIVTIFFVLYFASYWYLKFNNSTPFSLQNILFFLCFFSVFTTLLLNRANQTKETEKLNLLAGKLVNQQNPVTEVLYEQVERRLHADALLDQWIRQGSAGNKISQDSLVNYLKTKYFKDYWKKYQIQITLCDQKKELRIQPQGYLVNCSTYFRGIIDSYGKSTALSSLFFLDYGFGKEYYLAVYPGETLVTNPGAGTTVFIEFNLKNADPDPGYPGLLMDKTRMDMPNLSDYSYGLFHNGILVRAVGAAGYRTALKQYKEFSVRNPGFTEDQMIHFQYHINKTDTLLISKKEDDFLSVAAPFSYLFILFAATALLLAGVFSFPRKLNPVPDSLRNRLHFAIIGILVVTMLAIGIVQIINIIQINIKKNVDNLREKAYSVVVEVQHKYSSQRDLHEVEKIELEDFLIKLSNVFFTDINVYSDNGRLISSSRPQIFDEGLLSERMNAEAYRKLVAEQYSIFIHHESIGAMQFNSAYLPVYNEHDQLLGFVNLPYFAKQDESKKEISSFLVTFLNVYILLILFGIFVTVLISNYITAPLAMLAGKISQIRLGMVNEKIAWKQNDEVGQLVSEYNRMVDELGRSAEMLASSERESAWRVMARQVAHEIKNPLTPMKLSAQYLEKAWNEKAPDWDQRLARFTKTMVEQIDALSVIASDFSDFAKMPAVVLTRIDLEEVIRFVLALYQDTTQIKYEFQTDCSNPVIFGDRSQLIRLFTNLLNNSVQAIGNPHDGVITIAITREFQHIVVMVTDNGCGIPADRTKKIFQPDFTTKTSGMGLGLAIAKGIVEGMNGEISFISDEDKGTTFIIKFPANDQIS